METGTTSKGKSSDTLGKVEQLCDLKAWIEQWAHTQSYKAGVKFNWIDLDYQNLKTKNSKQYSKAYELIKSVGAVEIAHQSKQLDTKKREIKRAIYKLTNDDSSQKKYTLTIKSGVIQRNAYTFAVGVKLGAGLAVKAPFFEASLNSELNLETTEEQSREKSYEESTQVEVSVNAYSELIVEYTLYELPVIDAFRLVVNLQGKIPLYFNTEVVYQFGKIEKNAKGSRLIFVPIGSIFNDFKEKEEFPLKCKINSDISVELEIDGEYQSNAYVAATKTMKEVSLATGQLPKEEGAAAVSSKVQGTSVELVEAYEFKYSPGATAEGGYFAAPLSEMKELSADQIKIFMESFHGLVSSTIVSDKNIQAAKDEFTEALSKAPRASEHKDRPVTVAPTVIFRNVSFDFSSKIKEIKKETSTSDVKQPLTGEIVNSSQQPSQATFKQ